MIIIASFLTVSWASLTCLVCDVHYIDGPEGRKFVQGSERCTEPTDTTDMIGDYGVQGMCTISHQKQVFGNGTALVWITRSGQKRRDPNQKYPTTFTGSECEFEHKLLLCEFQIIILDYSDCTGDFCNGESARKFMEDRAQPAAVKLQNARYGIASGGSTCYTCTALTHNNTIEDLAPCLGTVKRLFNL